MASKVDIRLIPSLGRSFRGDQVDHVFDQAAEISIKLLEKVPALERVKARCMPLADGSLQVEFMKEVQGEQFAMKEIQMIRGLVQRLLVDDELSDLGLSSRELLLSK